MGEHRVHLRLCLARGHVGCHNDSKTARRSILHKRFHQTNHPIIQLA